MAKISCISNEAMVSKLNKYVYTVIKGRSLSTVNNDSNNKEFKKMSDDIDPRKSSLGFLDISTSEPYISGREFAQVEVTILECNLVYH